MTDRSDPLAALRALRDAVTDPAQLAALDTAIAALAPGRQPRRHRQKIGAGAQVDVAVAGDVHGNIYIAGRRTKSSTELLAGYLTRLQGRCGVLPLQGVREQKTGDDVLQISLDQVYTQLATTSLAGRETYTGKALKQFDANAYLEQHVGARLLPGQQRVQLRRPPTRQERILQREDAQELLEGRPLPDRALAPGEISQRIDQLDADALGQLSKQVSRLAFDGPQLVTEAIVASSRLVLLGEPGSGKSTALRYLALTLAAAGLDEAMNLSERLAGWSNKHGRLLPLLLPLLPLAKRLAALPGHAPAADDLWNYLADHLEANGRYAGLAAAVHDELEAGRALLLLDGLDEVAGADSRRQVVAAVRAFAEQYTRCRIVVACRVRAYEGEQNAAWRLPRWPTATLADWTIGQMEHFVAAWYAAAADAGDMPPAKRDERIQALQHAIQVRDDLQRLGVRPLLLTIMALVHLNDGRLPEDRVTLYSRCLDILLAQWEVRGKDETVYGTLMEYIGLPDADVRGLRALLEEAAFVAHEASAPGSPGRLGRATLRELVGAELRQRGHPNPWDGAERFLEYADVRAGLLQAGEAGDAYGFPHQTFQEYLAGLKLVSGVGVVGRIMERRRDDRWRLPILLGIADHVSGNKLEMPYLLLQKLLLAHGKPADEAQRDLLLAAEIGDDVGWDRLERGDAAFVDLRANLAAALGPVVEGTALPAAERVRAGVYLGQLGDLRAGVCDLPPRVVRVAGGLFVIGDGRERAELTIAAFALARYPVTKAQYKLFVDDGGYDLAQPWWDDAGRDWLALDDARADGLQSWQRRRFKDRPELWDDERWGIARPNHPVVGVSWYEAMAFCRWLTQHQQYNPDKSTYTLPSEAEWEYAARGSQRRTYPWGGTAPDGERANFEGIYDGTTAVGCFPAGGTPEGVLDLAGNVSEWTRSEYRDYPYDPNDGREWPDDLAKKRFTLRGGGWYVRSLDLRASDRSHFTPDFHHLFVGFRLARHRTNSG